MVVQFVKDVLFEFYHLLLEMAPWLLIGFFFAGLLHVFFPKESIKRTLGKNNLKSIIYATLLGIPLPLCSCGVVPTGISFNREGASNAATVSFFISTPQTGVDSIMITYSLMGLPFAIIRPIVALISGIFGGGITAFAGRKDQHDHASIKQEKNELGNFRNKVRTMFTYAFGDFLMDIAKWLIIGLFIAALIAVILPDDFFTTMLHHQTLNILLVLLASIPLYICATGSVPIAAVLMMKGLSPGAALVFLMAGPATNVATMGLIGKSLGTKTLLMYLVSIMVSAVGFGLLINELPQQWFNPMMVGAHEHEMLPHWLKLASGVSLIVLIVYGYLKKYFSSSIEKNFNMSEHILTIQVSGMTCNHCKASMEKSLKNLDFVSEAEADPGKEKVFIKGDHFDLKKIEKAVKEAGFVFKGEIK